MSNWQQKKQAGVNRQERKHLGGHESGTKKGNSMNTTNVQMLKEIINVVQVQDSLIGFRCKTQTKNNLKTNAQFLQQNIAGNLFIRQMLHLLYISVLQMLSPYVD